MAKPTPIQRFAALLVPDGDCWLWTGGKDPDGYGVFSDVKAYRAHRWSYEYHIAPIPEGLVLDHLCRNPSCVNPWHLEPVPIGVNTRRGVTVDLHPRVCPKGHTDTRYRGAGRGWYCPTCNAERWANRAPHIRPPRPRVKRTHCRKGHELTEENVRFRKCDGHRLCRECERQRSAARSLKGKAS